MDDAAPTDFDTAGVALGDELWVFSSGADLPREDLDLSLKIEKHFIGRDIRIPILTDLNKTRGKAIEDYE